MIYSKKEIINLVVWALSVRAYLDYDPCFSLSQIFNLAMQT